MLDSYSDMAPSTLLEPIDASPARECVSMSDLEALLTNTASFMTPEKTPLTTTKTIIRRSLFGESGGSNNKRRRLADPEVDTGLNKRRRVCHTMKRAPPSSELSPMSVIINAVDKMTTGSDLVADASRENVLPTIPGKHSDLNAISSVTLDDVINGRHADTIDHVTIIDCRYPYEYNGGHIKGAVNLYTKDMIQQFLHETMTSPSKVHVLIFHCEFSSKRGPKMYRFMRSLDRDLNKECYPKLNFPEIYLLEGGYKTFFETNMKVSCDPQSYLPMLHKDHATDLRHFRVKSKSWSAGEKQRPRIQSKENRVRLSF